MNATYISIEKNVDIFEQYKKLWGSRGITGIRVASMTEGIEMAIAIEKSKTEHIYFVAIVADDIDFMPLLAFLDGAVDAPILIATSNYNENEHHTALNNGAYFYGPYCDDPEWDLAKLSPNEYYQWLATGVYPLWSEALQPPEFIDFVFQINEKDESIDEPSHVTS